MKLKYSRLPSISKQQLINSLIEYKIISDVCLKLDINRHQFNSFLEMFEIKYENIVSKEELRELIKMKKIEESIARIGLTKESVLEDILELKSKNKILEKYGFKAKSVLDNIFEYFELDFDKLIPKETRLEIAKEHRKQTNLERFGYENAMFDPEKVDKIKQAWENKTEDEIEEIVQARRDTNIERYGSKHYWQSEDVKEKILERYGFVNAMQNKEIAFKNSELRREKVEDYITKEDLLSATLKYKTEAGIMRELNITRDQLRCLFDFYSLVHSDLVTSEERRLERLRLVEKTNLARYNSRHSMSSSEVRAKMKATWLRNYGVENPFTSDEIREKANATKLRNGTLARSSGERELEAFIKSIYSGVVELNTRKIVKGHELDLYIPEFKLAIEFNGAYWHSTEKKSKDYHFKKSLDCDRQGIRLMHIFESEWKTEQKRKIYTQLISNALNAKLIKLSAGKCTIKRVDSKTARKFFDENHLGGYSVAKVAYGLYYKDELVQVELFGKPRFSKSVEWESIRGASKLGYMIYGGYEKVLKQFKLDFDPQSIVSYVDFNIFSGRLHEHAGFKFERYTGPDHWYLDYDGVLKRYWIVRGNNPKDLQWAKERDENLIREYYFAGSKTYVWRK